MSRRTIAGYVFFFGILLAMGVVIHEKNHQENQESTVNQVTQTVKKSQNSGTVETTDSQESGMTYVKADPSGTLTGEDQGRELPVNVEVTYYLNGQKRTPEEMAGQTGEVKIRFDYDNTQKRKVTVDEVEETVSVPFLMLSAVILPSDVFSNVEISNGKIMEEEDQTIAVGTSFPGLWESLDLDSLGDAEELDFPDYVEITADANEFELDFTASVVEPLGMDEWNLEKLDDVEDLIDSMDELGNASAKLVDGTGELMDGVEKYQTAIDSYTQGTSQLESGIAAIRSAVTGYTSSDDDTMTKASSAITAIAADAKTLGEEMSQLQTGLQTIQKFAVEAAEYKQTVSDELVQLTEGMNTVQTQIVSAGESMGQADSNATSQAREQMQLAIDQVVSQTEADVSLTDEEKEAVKTALNRVSVDGISITNVMGEAKSSLDAANTLLESISSAPQIPEITMPQLNIQTDGITDALTDMGDQLKLLSGLSTSMSGMSDGISQLAQSLTELESGASQLTTYNSQLKEGIAALADGSEGLQDGMTTFDQEGIQKLQDLAGSDLQKLLRRVKALKKAQKDYGSGQEYVIETEEIAIED